MKKILILTTCLLGGLVAATAPGGPKLDEVAEVQGGKYFQYTHPIDDAGHAIKSLKDGLYIGATDLEDPVKTNSLDLVARHSTYAYEASEMLGNDTDRACEDLFNRLTVLKESINKTHGEEIAAIAKAMRILARELGGFKTTDGKSGRAR